MIKDTHIVNNPNLFCPKCGKVLDGFMARHERFPQEGDLSLCAYCFVMLRITGHEKK